MKRRSSWSAEIALSFYRRLALDKGDDFLSRNNWDSSPDDDGYSLSEMDSIYAEIIAKIPAGATKVLEVGCGEGRFYRALKAARPGLGYRGMDIVPENIIAAQTARGTIVCAGVQAADTVTINGVTLTASSSQTPGGLDFNEQASPTASSLVAAINDAGNGLSASVVASNQGDVVTVRAKSTGTAGNAITLASSSATTLAVSGATLADGEDPGLFELGNALEYLSEATMDWDFVVSIGCLFHCSDSRNPSLVFDLLDAKSPKGFFILADPLQMPPSFLTTKVPAAETLSVNVAGSYYDGARTFLDDVTLLKGLTHPFYLHRDSTTAVAPTLETRYCPVATGRLNRVLERQETTRDLVQGKVAPVNITGFASSGGLITGTAARAVPPEVTVDLSRFVRP